MFTIIIFFFIDQIHRESSNPWRQRSRSGRLERGACPADSFSLPFTTTHAEEIHLTSVRPNIDSSCTGCLQHHPAPRYTADAFSKNLNSVGVSYQESLRRLSHDAGTDPVQSAQLNWISEQGRRKWRGCFCCCFCYTGRKPNL